MKKLILALFVLSAVITVTACKSNENASSNTSSANWQVLSGVTENDLFDVNGNSSEYTLTSSQFGELLQNQSDPAADNGNTSVTENGSKNADSKAQEETDSNNSGSSSADKGNTTTTSKTENGATSSAIGTDKDGDGWTDGWN